MLRDSVLVLSVAMPIVCGPSGSPAETVAAPARLELAAARVEVAFDAGPGAPLVSAALPSGRALRLVFDTGAVGLMLNRAVAGAEGLEVVGETRFHSPLGDGSGVTTQQVSIERLTLGAARLHGVVADLWDGDPLHGSDGVLGLSMLRDALATLDFPGNRLILAHGSLHAADEDVFPFRFDPGGVPEVSIQVGKTKLRAHLDTGNPVGFVLPLDVRDSVPWSVEPRVVGRARTVEAVKTLYSATLGAPLVLFGHAIEGAVVHLLEGSPAAGVGYATLREWLLTFDQEHRLLRVRRP